MEADQEARRGYGPSVRDRSRVGAAIVLGDQRVRRGEVFLGNQRRSAFQDRGAARFGRLRLDGRRQDSPEIRRKPVYEAGRLEQWVASDSRRRCQRDAIVDGVWRGPDVGMRSQQRSVTTAERARTL